MNKISFVPIVVVVVVFFLLAPFGEYAVNDDWDFYTHVRNFKQGDFTKNALIDSAFILQGFIGVLWSYIFGLSFVSLRFLTLCFAVIFALGFGKVLETLQVPKGLQLVATLTALFNPIFLLSSTSFMTEAYFLCFAIWSVYFLLKYQQTALQRDFVFSLILGSLSIMIRQLGLLLVPALLFGVIWIDYKKRSYKLSNYLISFGFVLLACTAVFIWPQYPDLSRNAKTFTVRVLDNLKNIQVLPELLYYSLPYIGFSILPLGIWLFFAQKNMTKVFIVLFSLLLFNDFYTVDIFKFGNVLFPEGVMIKNNYIHHLTLFDNLLFKSGLCFLCNLSFLSFVTAFAIKVNRKVDTPLGLMTTLFVAFLVPALVYDPFYDRYIINALMICVILATLVIKDNLILKDVGKMYTILTIIFGLYSFMLLQDFIVTTKTQWRQAELLKATKDVGNGVFLSSTYSKYSSVFFKPNSPSIQNSTQRGVTYKCYVQKDVEEQKSKLIYRLINRVESSRTVNRYIANPKIFGESKLPGFTTPSHDPNKILFKERIFSLPEYLVGNDAFVVTYCTS